MAAKSQARRLYDAFAELARRYQHRDVDVAAYRGLMDRERPHLKLVVDGKSPALAAAE